MWNRIKSFFRGGDRPAGPGSTVPGIPHLGAGESPWGVPVLDVRPVTLGMLSTSSNRSCAENMMMLSRDDGTRFVGVAPNSSLQFHSGLRFRIEGSLAEGVLFKPDEMEHKWAIYYLNSRLVFVRSWTLEVMLTAETEIRGDWLEITSCRGTLIPHSDDASWQKRLLDYMIRTHCLQSAFPVPLQNEEMASDASAAAMFCMSTFGNLAEAATHHLLSEAPPDRPLRTNSLLHIAVAKNNAERVRELLADGIPIDLPAQDGLTPLHWALAGEDDSMIQLLLDSGSPVDVRSAEGATPLMNAVQGNAADRVAFFIRQGADVNASDNRGFTSLHRAAEMGLLDIAKQLVEAGAETDVEAEGHTPKSLAKARNEAAMTRFLNSH